MELEFLGLYSFLPDILRFYIAQFKHILLFKYMRLGHNYSILITNKASLLVYDVLVKQYIDQQTSRTK